MKLKVCAVLLTLAAAAPVAALAKPTAPPRPPRTMVVHDHAPRPHTNSPAPHK